MSWSVERVDLGGIRRNKKLPNYAIIEQAIAGGTAFSIAGGAGYFIVGAENSLAPGFVVELALPELAVVDKYKALAAEMTRRSLGTMWFDSTDSDACDLAWRLGLTIRSGPPLFVSDGMRQDAPLDGFQVRIAEKADEARVVELLTLPPPDAGGQTKEATKQNLDGGCVAILVNDKDVLGAAVLLPLTGPYVALSAVVMDTFSELPAQAHDKAHRALELFFMTRLASAVAKKGQTLVYSMARQTPMGYLEAISMRMKIVKQSFTANLSAFAPVFEAKIPEGARAII
jgi:hypothetical protein